MGKWKRKYRDLLMRRKAKLDVCIPAHLPLEIGEHIMKEAFERGWSNSQYMRWLAILDKKRVDDEAHLMARVTDIPTEQFDLIERKEQQPK